MRYINHILPALLAILLTVMTSVATTPTAASLLQQAAGELRKSPAIEARFSATASGSKTSGDILISGNRFRLTTQDATVWFDGHTQWAYSAANKEVNICEPTMEEISQVNPFAIVSGLQKGYNTRRLTAPKGSDRLEFTPKTKREAFRKVVLTLNSASHLPQAIAVTLSDGSSVSINVSSIKKIAKVPGAENFRFEKKKYPGVEIVDLR